MAKAKTQRGGKLLRVREVIDVMQQLFPPALAETWDNIGLQLGEPEAPVRRVLVALDPTLAAVRQAGSDAALVCHHPLLIGDLPRRLDLSTPLGRVIQRATSHRVAIIAAHTNADWGIGGVNEILAFKLGLTDVRPWQPLYPEQYRKLVVFVPDSHLVAVSEAMFAAGAGVIGDYAKCSYRLSGQGTYLPLDRATPYAGRVGKLSVEPETRLEVRVPLAKVDAVLVAMRRAHPYQEVAFDLYPTERQNPQGGRGRLGRVATPLTLAAFANRAARVLRVRTARFVGDPRRTVKEVLVCAGSGAGFIDELRACPQTLLVTGDMKYHDACRARDSGLAVLDLGHYGTELPFVDAVVPRLKAGLAALGHAANVRAAKPVGDPFQPV